MKRTTKRTKGIKVHGEGFSSAAEALESAKEAARAGKTAVVYEKVAIRDLPAKAGASVRGGTAACWIRVFPKGGV